MLATSSCTLASRARVLTSIAGTQRSLDSLDARLAGCAALHERLLLDYRDDEARSLALDRSVAAHGPIDLVLAWINEAEPLVALSVARALRGPARFLHVLGSAAGSPEDPASSIRRPFLEISGIDYAQVILGFALERGGSRWLRDEEISAGVDEVLDRHCERLVVGTVTPWSSRP
jgi:hypothetical protein